MNKIQQLLQQLCPEGVEFKELGEVVIILDSQRKPVSKSQRTGGKYPYYGANGIQDYVDDFIFDGVFILLGEDGSVINKDGSPVLNWATGKIWVNNHAHILAEKSDIAILRYVFFALSVIDVTKVVKGSIPKITQQNLRAFQIPIPPLPIQQEIVTILDSFTQLEAELEAELEARRKQYEYYRDKLLNFNNKRGYNWLTLRELCLKTDNMKWKENDNIDFKYIDLSSVDRMSNKITETQIITSQNAPSRAQQIVRNNDVIFGTTRPTLKRYCLITPEYDGQICSTGFCVLRANTEMILPKYLFFVLTTSDFYNYVENNQEGAGYPAISNSKVKEYKMAVPSIEEQNRIVEVLDKFDSLVNDISIGLPAEIDGRRKQYNYYRGKLLSFQPVTAGLTRSPQ
jgi:type I restriction enzyme S subunit